MKTAIVAIVLALPVYAQQHTPAMGGPNGATCPPNTGCATPPEVAPTLSASQVIALKGVDEDEKNLQTAWQTDEGKRNAIAQEFTQQHPGWTIGRNNEPQKVQAPTPPAEPKK